MPNLASDVRTSDNDSVASCTADAVELLLE